MIKSVLRDIDLILEASAERDRKYRREAATVKRAIIQYLVNSNKVLDYEEKTGQYAIDMKNVDPEYGNLLLVFARKKGGKAGSHMYMRKGPWSSVITIRCLPKVIPADINIRQKLAVYLNEHEHDKTFMHEFIHYLDSKRGGEGLKADAYKRLGYRKKKHFKGDTLVLSRVRGKRKAERNAYSTRQFNIPQEFNAYFQSEADKIETKVTHEMVQSSDGEVPTLGRSYREFYKNAIGSFQSDFVNNLNSKYAKKLKSRLFQLYVGLKKDVEVFNSAKDLISDKVYANITEAEVKELLDNASNMLVKGLDWPKDFSENTLYTHLTKTIRLIARKYVVIRSGKIKFIKMK